VQNSSLAYFGGVVIAKAQPEAIRFNRTRMTRIIRMGTDNYKKKSVSIRFIRVIRIPFIRALRLKGLLRQPHLLPVFLQHQNKYITLQLRKHFIMDSQMLNNIISVLGNSPVEKAWLFGSFARNEDDEQSDIDMLIQFTPNEKITLFRYGGIVYNLEQITGRKVDLVEEGMLQSFALETAERDKVLIYEKYRTG
jgi:predicted nucleotidyltransferase